MSAALDDVYSLEQKLSTWGRWLWSANDAGVGYSKVNVVYKMMKHGQPIRGTGGSQTPDDETAEQVEIAVQALTLYEPNQAEALRTRYKHINWTDEDCARLLKVSRRTFQRWLAKGRESVDRIIDL